MKNIWERATKFWSFFHIRFVPVCRSACELTFETFLPLQIQICNAAFKAGEKLGHLNFTRFTVLLRKDISPCTLYWIKPPKNFIKKFRYISWWYSDINSEFDTAGQNSQKKIFLTYSSLTLQYHILKIHTCVLSLLGSSNVTFCGLHGLSKQPEMSHLDI